MKFNSLVLTAGMMLGSVSASAAYNCFFISTAGFSISYVAGTSMSQQSSVTVRCTRAAGDPATMTYYISADDGLNPNGGKNRAREVVGAASYFVNYGVYQNAACSTALGPDLNSPMPVTITFPGGSTAPIDKTTFYYGCVTPQTGMPGGQYDDSLILYVAPPPNYNYTTATVPVAIFAPASCTMSALPNVAFAYTAFGPLVVANSTFTATCTTLMPYAMALNSTSGTVIGLAYSLGLNTLGVASLTSTGTGAAQAYAIRGSMAAGQAGICGAGCPAGSQAHTVTISY